MELLQVRNISKVYRTSRSAAEFRALNNISFSVQEGEFVGVMGASGSGKTTLLNIIGGIDKPTTGKCVIAGQDITVLDKSRLAQFRVKNIGFIFQDFNLLETMTLKENILLPLALNGYSAAEMERRLNQLSADLGIGRVLAKYPYEVSGGEQQRAAACRALITNPKIILADEPTGNLDSNSGKALLDLLSMINKKYSAAILMVTHDVFAASYCHRIMFIRDGEIYNELYAGESRKHFFDAIIDVVGVLGGEAYEPGFPGCAKH